ncbi:N-acetylglucosamine-6-sulfatase-like isoform X2 [Neocloeon triangulifer]|uniref:N-acetylglucosamine-6-sulfatase-like isoform X2 n=1 Tax=Neocloeon triangulifer TaxID=2078957 RepID=UPI00286F7929|nr:N-acetylglucosamine-6-sulfatase-like isoform X2 [Neocloeon triangulifer]
MSTVFLRIVIFSLTFLNSVLKIYGRPDNIILILTDDQDLVKTGFYGKNGPAVPKGWDWWMGLEGNSRYQNYTLSVNGTWRDYADRPDDYLTDVMAKSALEFLNQGHVRSEPFLMVLATPAAHDPFTPAERYKDRFEHVRVPKGKDFNLHNQGKHWIVQNMPPHTLSDETISKIDDIYRNRLKTLLSVDEIVEKIVLKLEKLQILERTHLIFTSDHGYHLGQFALPWDKRQPYEFDLRVPFVIRGPGIPKNQSFPFPVLLTDLAPTFLQIAGTKDDEADGVSLFNLIEAEKLNRTFLIEFHGEAHSDSVSENCPDVYRDRDQFFQCTLENSCKCQDVRNNTYHCLRHLSDRCDFIFCHFEDDEDFEEFYDLRSDPLQLENTASVLPPHHLQFYRKSLHKLKNCKGRDCRELRKMKVLCPLETQKNK